MDAFVNPDLHIHSNYSDGSDSPSEILEKVKVAGVDIFSLTDHDCYEGCAVISALLKPEDPKFIGGIELSCEDETGKYHILGYCYNLNKPALREAVKLTHDTRIEKARNRFAFLDSLGFSFSRDEIEQTLALKNPGKPHIASLMFKYGYAATKEEGFRILSGYHGKEFKLTPEMGIDAILQSDGIPVLAHGILADGSKNLSKEETTVRVKRLKKAGLMGLECYYSTFTKEQQEIMLSLADAFNLLVTAGSDFHGRNKTVSLGQTGDPSPKQMQRFYQAVKLLIEELH